MKEEQGRVQEDEEIAEKSWKMSDKHVLKGGIGHTL